ncbi:MAG: prolyl oligopeptidase family serine peptidase [Thermoguttaceae bacterium]|nr:prolyl oligopeptidase family serine peptidase [Thermoguttaceae bacterium]
MKTLFAFLGGAVLMLGTAAFFTSAKAQDVPVGVQTKLTVELSAREAFPDEEGKIVDPDAKEQVSFLLYIPKNDAEKTEAGFPLMLFLHGAGDRGDDIELVKKAGPPKIIEKAERGKMWPFLTVSPQCPKGKRWSGEQLLELLDYVMENYPVDPDRVYVTGLSMGGSGTWRLLAIAPERFAAAVPMCGRGDPAAAGKMLDVPIWVYHGDSDNIVPVEESEAMVKAIWEKGGTKVKLTEYPGVKHNCWIRGYSDPGFNNWLLKHKRVKPDGKPLPKKNSGKPAQESR